MAFRLMDAPKVRLCPAQADIHQAERITPGEETVSAPQLGWHDNLAGVAGYIAAETPDSAMLA